MNKLLSPELAAQIATWINCNDETTEYVYVANGKDWRLTLRKRVNGAPIWVAAFDTDRLLEILPTETYLKKDDHSYYQGVSGAGIYGTLVKTDGFERPADALGSLFITLMRKTNPS